ncbi:DUF1761 domain-containing protein [Pelagovum sp. HNIBRBA483]|uniref:DUF1761 domain-containing protein n=1 Tax=Pelagovum sp. HNIBRBA483 TaxID=3233341 RepID=UPI0034A0F89A
MELISVLVAAAASWVLGAVYYMALSKQWLEVSGIPRDAEGKIEGGGSPLPFILSAIAMILVAGMMRHIFAGAGIDTVGKGVLAGLGVGAFFITPWTMINNAYGFRPFKLTVIDSGYSILGCGLIGGVLNLF